MRKHALLNRFGNACLYPLLALLVAGLVACGGGSSTDGGAPAPTPTSVGNLNLVLNAPVAPADRPSTPDTFDSMTVDGVGNVYVKRSNWGRSSAGDLTFDAGFYTFIPNAPALSRIGDASSEDSWVAMVAAQDSLYVAYKGVTCQFCDQTKRKPELLRLHIGGGTEVLLKGAALNYEMGIHYELTGLDRDAQGNIFFAKAWLYGKPQGEILKYTSAGVLKSIAMHPSALRDVKLGSDGVLYTASCTDDGCGVLKVSVDGTFSPFGNGKFVRVSSLALDGKGNVYLADSDNHTVHKITAQGAVSTIAGVAGKPGSATGPLPASLSSPRSLSYSPSDNKLYLISGGAIVSIDLPN